MSVPIFAGGLQQVSLLLRGDLEEAERWSRGRDWSQFWTQGVVIVVGSGLFGAAMGCWRSPLQAWYGALKFPLVIFATSLGNALLNSMLASLLGLNLGFRESLRTILMSFTLAALILASFSPLVAFLAWNTPPRTAGAWERSWVSYLIIQLTQVGTIALAGVVANLRLLQWLQRWSGSRGTARRILAAWLLVNLFLGSQLSWILRPFIGSPDLPVEFLRPNAFAGNFFETVFSAVSHLIF